MIFYYVIIILLKVKSLGIDLMKLSLLLDELIIINGILFSLIVSLF